MSIFVLHLLSGKWQGVAALCEYLRITPHEVICIGDESNDIEMLKKAGLGIAMGNASMEVKSAADYVTLSNKEDGVAVALERFI